MRLCSGDSWQLELLVTGFALAGMIGGLSTFSDWMNYILDALDKDDTAANIAEGIIVTFGIAYMITLINFFAHVVIRCLWIGAIGSRSRYGRYRLPEGGRSLRPSRVFYPAATAVSTATSSGSTRSPA